MPPLLATRSRLAALLACAALIGCGDDEGGGGGGGGDGSTRAAGGDQPANTQPVISGGDAGDGGSLARVPEIYEALEPSIVAIEVSGGRGQGEGSGVVYRPNIVVTNFHVVQNAERIRIALATGERLDARMEAGDPLTDLAVLRVEGDQELPPAPFRNELPQVGSLAIAMGNPLGFENSVTAGIVSGLGRAVPSGGTTPSLVGLIQTDAAISPGNSGGALVGENGQVIGINVAYIPPQARAVSIGFAIPSPTVIDVVQQLLENGEVQHAFLGVVPRPLTPAIRQQLGLEVEEGAVVGAVERGGPAADAGIRPGDVIVQIGDREIRRVEDLFAALRQQDPGEQVQVTVVRDGERRQLEVELAERPNAPSG